MRFGQDELDIVAFDPEFVELVFVEVKTRHDTRFGDPSEAVDQRKLKALVRAGGQHVIQNHYTGDYRFDIIAIWPQNLEHFRNVTWP